MRTFLPLVLTLIAACSIPPGETGGDLATPSDLRTSPDLATAPDGAPPPDLSSSACVGLSECDCLAQKDTCEPITETCYCPFPQCGGGACLCGGGKYHGCAPKASACPNPVDCRPAGRLSGPDAKGCFSCVYQSTCEDAWKQLVEKLRGGPDCPLPEAQIEGFSCAKNPACVTACINAVSTCKDIGCGLCLRCGCGSLGNFERCFYDCQK